jgi:hypothetical protein
LRGGEKQENVKENKKKKRKYTVAIERMKYV